MEVGKILKCFVKRKNVIFEKSKTNEVTCFLLKCEKVLMGKCISKGNDSNNPPFKQDRENMAGKLKTLRFRNGRNEGYDFHQPKHEKQNHYPTVRRNKSEQEGAPSIPTGKIKIETKSQNSIKISWGIPENNGGCPLKGFIVEKQTRLKRDWKQCGNVDCSNLSVEINDLSPTEKYVFRVKAYNDIMEGNALTSEEYIHRLNILNTDPPQEPLGPLTYTVIADGIVKLCWSQDERRDKHFTKIKVQQSLSDSSEFTDAKTKNIERNSCDVTFLRLDQKYNFRVAGVSSDETVGYWLTGGFYPVFPRLEKPNPPSCLKILYTSDQEDKAYIQWKESDTNGSMVLSYSVLMKHVKENEWRIFAKDITNNSVNCPFHLMENHKKYHFQVMAKNEKGFSFPSETSEEIINKSVPSPPTNLNCEIKATNVLLKWNAPESDGGYPILHYCLKPRNENWIELPANNNKHTIKKLFDNSTIEFAIVAKNVKGKSEESFFSYKVEEITYDRSVTNKVTEKRYIPKVQTTLRHRYSIIKGLPNVGMTCYANCIFQILGQTPGLLQHLEILLQNNRYLDRELSVVSMLIRLITDLNSIDEENYSSIVNFNLVTSLIDDICLSDNSFARGKQNDSHSFIMALFNTVKNEIKTQDRSRSRNRETSGRRVKSAERLLDKPGNQAVHSLQKRSQSNRRLTNEDEDFGGRHIDANMKTINIEKESPLYMFDGYLSRRFTYEPCGHDEFSDKQLFTSILVPVKDQHGTRLEKMHKLVKYKEYLLVTETCVSEKQQIKEIKKKYMLYGVALHSGTINFGHYYAYVRKNSCDTTEGSRFWYECNDSLVFPVSPKDVLNDPKAFLLFYKSEKN
ncbi:hypothetical protein KUTeg_007070 [Tegillarca granosa]|uniref:Ubiquitin carboxyl-terminal hydrolase n=1 Tax=Tegillarca granosa TaxID=220873 RepID=A0ABQ9FF76_TEGGR|nr:hypothetical protein KUTeg_007070 [Tegillarca granosa]